MKFTHSLFFICFLRHRILSAYEKMRSQHCDAALLRIRDIQIITLFAHSNLNTFCALKPLKRHNIKFFDKNFINRYFKNKGNQGNKKPSINKNNTAYFFLLSKKYKNRLRIEVAVTDKRSKLNANEVPYDEYVPVAPNPNR